MNGSNCSLKDHSWGVTSTSKSTRGCRVLNSPFLQLRETFTLSKEETDLIAPGGWNDEQLVSQKESLEMD